MAKERKTRADGRYSINLSFTQAEKNLIDHVDSKGSFTNYVKYLIRKDMEGEKVQAIPSLTPEMIQQLLKDNFQKEQPKEEQPKTEMKISPKKLNKGAMKNILGKKF